MFQTRIIMLTCIYSVLCTFWPLDLDTSFGGSPYIQFEETEKQPRWGESEPSLCLWEGSFSVFQFLLPNSSGKLPGDFFEKTEKATPQRICAPSMSLGLSVSLFSLFTTLEMLRNSLRNVPELFRNEKTQKLTN